MGMLYAAGKADEESDMYYQQHLKASISKREKEKIKREWEQGVDMKMQPLPEKTIKMYCESPGCNNELVHRQEMLWGKCDSCMFP